MERVVVLGRGGAGKSTFSGRLGEITDLPVIELDELFWDDELNPLSTEDWLERQRDIAAEPRWIMDGDLGPYDSPGPRMERADTVIILDLSFIRCAWRIRRRGPHRRDFWWWVLTWRFRWRRDAVQLATVVAPHATLVSLATPHQVEAFLHGLARDLAA